MCALNASDLSCWEELEDLGRPFRLQEVVEWSDLNLLPGGLGIKLQGAANKLGGVLLIFPSGARGLNFLVVPGEESTFHCRGFGSDL